MTSTSEPTGADTVTPDSHGRETYEFAVYATQGVDGATTFARYSRATQRIVSEFEVQEPVRLGTPALVGRSIVLQAGGSVGLYDFGGRLLTTLAVLDEGESVSGIAVSHEEAYVAIGILSPLVDDSRMVVIDLATADEVLRISQDQFEELATLGSPAPIGWLPDDSGVELRSEVGKDATSLPGVTAYLSGSLVRHDGGPRVFSQEGRRALSSGGEVITSCDGAGIFHTELSLVDVDTGKTVADVSAPGRVVLSAFLAPDGTEVLLETGGRQPTCVDTNSEPLWYHWAGQRMSEISDPELIARSWYTDPLIELGCGGQKAVMPYVRNPVDMRCDTEALAELLIDGVRVDEAPVVSLIGFTN